MPRRPLLVALLAGALVAALPATADPDVALLKAAGVADDGPALLAYLRSRTVADADRDRIRQTIRELGDPRYAVREAASKRIVKFGLPAVGLLRQAESDPDTEIARRAERCRQQIEKVPTAALSAAVTRRLAVAKPAGGVVALLAYLPQADDDAVTDAVLDALSAMAATGDGRPEPALMAAVTDALPARRGIAAEALARTAIPAAVELVQKSMADADPEVGLRAALALATYANDRTAVTDLIRKLPTLPREQAWRAEEALVRLAGENGPQVSLGDSPDDRERCRAAWQAWYDRAGAAVDLGRLQRVPRYLGRTLVVILEQRRANGRVREVDQKGDTLWQIDGLTYPHDAAVVGPNRVAVAEFAGNVVTERDFTGKVLWSKSVQNPSFVQPTADGGIVIGHRGGIVELDASRKETFAYTRQPPDLLAVRQGADGRFVMLTTGGQCWRVERDRTAKQMFSVGRLPPSVACLDLLPNGNVLVTRITNVAEFDPQGTQTWESPTVRHPGSCQRLPNGNVLVTGTANSEVVEYDRAQNEVWKYKPPEAGCWRARRR